MVGLIGLAGHPDFATARWLQMAIDPYGTLWHHANLPCPTSEAHGGCHVGWRRTPNTALVARLCAISLDAFAVSRTMCGGGALALAVLPPAVVLAGRATLSLPLLLFVRA